MDGTRAAIVWRWSRRAADSIRDGDPLNLARAFIDRQELSIAGVLLCRIVLDERVNCVNPNALVSSQNSHLAGDRLRQRRLQHERFPAVLELNRLTGQQAGGIDLS